MIDRYPNTDGCRLDSGENFPTGPAIDLHGMLNSKDPDHPSGSLWVRESGTQNDQVHATAPVSANDLIALRDGIDRMLRAAGYRGA